MKRHMFPARTAIFTSKDLLLTLILVPLTVLASSDPS
jgi:hypothetical protein